jgi:DNA-binding response OmpR family regulator
LLTFTGEPRALRLKQRDERHEITSNTAWRTFIARRGLLLMGAMSRIAIYEEDDLMRALLKEWLSEAGYRVREAAPGRVQRGGSEDLVIASVYVPKHAGAQLLREVQAAHPGTPLIAISGQFRCGLCATGTTAQMPGVEQVLAKPLTRGELLHAVRAIIGAPRVSA